MTGIKVNYKSPALVKFHFVEDVILCCWTYSSGVLKVYRAFGSGLLGLQGKVL
jgi:hypothetical protein